MAAAGAGAFRLTRRSAPGARRLAADAENHGFALDLAHRRLVYLHGAYPRKSYLCVQPLPSGSSSCRRVKGYSLEGAVFPMKPGRTAFVEGRHHRDELYAEPDDALPGHALLRVELQTGRVARSYPLQDSAKVLAVAEPRWQSEPVVLYQDKEGVRLAPAGARPELSAGGVTLPLSRAGTAALAEDYPSAAATAWGPGGAGLRFFDAGSGAAGKDLGLDSPGLLQSLGEDRWLVTARDSETGRDTVLELDRSTGRLRALLSCEGEATSVALGARRLYAVCQSSHGPFDPKRRWLHPQELRAAGLDDPRAAWTIPWTQHPGRLLGVDAAAGVLYYAVTDRDQAAVWAVDARPEPLRRAAALMDRGSPLSAGMAAGFVLTALAVTFAVGTLWLLINGPR